MAKTQRATNTSYLTEFQRQKILELKSKGKTHAQIAHTIKCTPAAVTYTLQHFKRHRSVKNSPKPGHPVSIPPKILGYLKAALAKHQIKPRATTAACANWIKSHYGLEIRPNTLYRTLQRTPMRTYIVQNKPPLSASNRAKRVTFAKRWEKATRAILDTLVFSDEAKLDGLPHPGKEVVWDKPNTPLHEGRTRVKVSSKVPSVNIWAAITRRGVLAYTVFEGILNSAGYMKILQENLLPAAHKQFGTSKRWVYQQDNAPIHTAKKIKAMFGTKPWAKTDIMEWPPYSPDLNLIENFWVHLRRKIAALKPNGVSNIKNATMEVIDQLNEEEDETHYFRNLFNSFPTRCKEALAADGFSTKH